MVQATITIAGNGEWGMSIGNGKLKNGNKSRELEIKLLIGLGFKLGFVPFFIFPVPVLIPRFTSIHFSEFISPVNLSGGIAKCKLFSQTTLEMETKGTKKYLTFYFLRST